MPSNGMFITLKDEASLALYLREGVFSQHMDPQSEEPHHRSNHYKILADYATARPGTHVFFFRKRQIYYGGQVVGTEDDGAAFYLNGPTSPLGREAQSGVGWDESGRDEYHATEEAGVFQDPDRGDDAEDKRTSQPFLILFDTESDLSGRHIESDELYFELGHKPYPVQSNTMRGVGFCHLGPGETDLLLERLHQSDQRYDPLTADVTVPDVRFDPHKIVEYTTDIPLQSLHADGRKTDDIRKDGLNSEAHLEAAVIANPSLLPDPLQPKDRIVGRQAPISPLKPMGTDEVDLCYYSPAVEDGFYPQMVVELKYSTADRSDAEQVVRYREAMDKMTKYYLNSVDEDDLQVGMYASEYDSEFQHGLTEDAKHRIAFFQFDEGSKRKQFDHDIDERG